MSITPSSYIIFVYIQYLPVIRINCVFRYPSFNFKAKAEDIDSGSNSQIYYSLIRSYPRNGVFKINSTTGVISTSSVLNRDNTPYLTITIKATDEGVPPLESETNVTVEVLDWNTHAPVIHNLPASVNINEATSGGVKIFRVNATDADVGKNAKLRYSIVSGKFIYLFI